MSLNNEYRKSALRIKEYEEMDSSILVQRLIIYCQNLISTRLFQQGQMANSVCDCNAVSVLMYGFFEDIDVFRVSQIGQHIFSFPLEAKKKNPQTMQKVLWKRAEDQF